MDSKRLDLNLLVTLEALLVERNVTKAAARLHLSQPAVSAQLNRLRAHFGDPLLIPAQRGMTPTAKAVELLGPLNEALDGVRSTVGQHARFDPASAEFTVHIAASDHLQAVLVSPLLEELGRLAPGVRVALRKLDPAALPAQMAGGEIDLAVMDPQAAAPGLRARPLFDERYVLIGRPGHPRLRPGLTVEEFAGLDFVVVSLAGGGFHTPVDEALAAIGKTRRVVLSSPSFLLVPGIVAQSDLVALVPGRLVRGAGPALGCWPPPLAVDGFQVAMVWHARNHAHLGQRWLREVLASLFGEGPAQPQAAV